MCAPIVPVLGLVVSAAGTAAGMAQASAAASQQAAIAQQQANMQAQMAEVNVAMNNQRLNQQSLFQWQNQRQQQQLQQQQQQFQFNQQMAQQRQQLQQQLQQQTLQVEQSRAQQRIQVQQQAANMRLQQEQATNAYNLQITQANAQIANQYKAARQSVLNDRATIAAKNEADRLVYQKRVEFSQEQVRNNNAAANRVYVAEQAKLNEAKKRAAFEQQAILAKAIGDKGSILATGRTGQSIGLLVQDVERQAGFALAQQAASLDSAQESAIVAMEGGFLDAQSANNQVEANLGFAPQTPYMPGLPEEPTFVNPVGLAIGTIADGK